MRLAGRTNESGCAPLLLVEMVPRAVNPARSASRRGLAACYLGRDFVSGFNVVEIAEGGLQLFERSDEGSVARAMFSIGGETGEKLRCISQLFGLDPNSVAPIG